MQRKVKRESELLPIMLCFAWESRPLPRMPSFAEVSKGNSREHGWMLACLEKRSWPWKSFEMMDRVETTIHQGGVQEISNPTHLHVHGHCTRMTRIQIRVQNSFDAHEHHVTMPEI